MKSAPTVMAFTLALVIIAIEITHANAAAAEPSMRAEDPFESVTSQPTPNGYGI